MTSAPDAVCRHLRAAGGLTPEANSDAAAAFHEQATSPLAISPWSAVEFHSALGLKVRTRALGIIFMLGKGSLQDA